MRDIRVDEANTVFKFLMRKTRVGELCIIRDEGWCVDTVIIDNEDLFHVGHKLSEKLVKSDEWGFRRIVTKSGDDLMIPVHFIDV